nr:citrate/2-methylcitrate synthase [Spirochaetota bacterium]
MKDVVTNIILKAAELARRETSNEPEPDVTKPAEWPIQCTVGPGLEGAIACESKIGYVNGSKGWLIYRGYDIFDLCAYSTFEEVSYLLLHGELPTKRQFQEYNNKLKNYRHLNKTLRLLMGFPVESMNAMGALRLGTNLMRQEFTYLDSEMDHPLKKDTIGSDEDSIAMETAPQGGKQATFEIKLRNLYQRAMKVRKNTVRKSLDEASGVEA